MQCESNKESLLASSVHLQGRIDKLAEQWFSQKDPQVTEYPAREKIVHDPIYGTIKLSKELIFVLDLPCVQRLRRIRQLSLVYEIYPSANHTRFEHSLGVSHLAGRMIEQIRDSDPPVKLTRDDLLLVRVAGLLHDVGHIALAHVTEPLLDLEPAIAELCSNYREAKPSEILSKLIIESKYFEAALERVNAEAKTDLRPSDVSNIIIGSAPERDKSKKFLAEVMHGTVDADRIDYLARDSHFTGVPLGRVDADRLIHTARIYQGLYGYFYLGFDIKGRQALESLVVARELMYSSVYYHHSARACAGMALRATEALLSGEKPAIFDAISLLELDDSQLLEVMRSSPGLPRKVVARLENRELYKAALTLRTEDAVDKNALRKFIDDLTPQKRKEHERAVIEDSDYGGLEAVIIDLPRIEPLKEVSITVIEKDGRRVPLSDLSGIVGGIESEAPKKWRGYVFCQKEALANVAKAFKTHFAGEGISFN